MSKAALPVLILLAGMATSTSAVADDELPPVRTLPQQEAQPEARPEIANDEQPRSLPDDKSPGISVALAIGTTVVGWGLLAEGIRSDSAVLGNSFGLAGTLASLAGPSAGHFYSGEIKHGLLFSGLRTASLGLVIAGAVVASPIGHTHSDEESSGDNAGGTMIVAGLAAYVGLTVYDWVGAAGAARRANAHRRAEAQLTIVPTTTRNAGAGMALVGSF
jgi:hypothetical protein